MPTVIATSIPKNTPVPIPWRLADPGPLAKTSGSIPSTKASDGITIGRNSVIGAGSVVTKDIPAGVIAAGSPCKVIREITEDDLLEEIQ